MGKLRGEKDIEATIQRLDRLTLDEGRATAAQTLEVVCGLVQQKRAIMDGENSICPALPSLPTKYHISRRRRGRSRNWYLARFRYGFNRLATTRRYDVCLGDRNHARNREQIEQGRTYVRRPYRQTRNTERDFYR